MDDSVVYVMKIKGVERMPDFIQVRDAQFTLIGYFRADKPHSARALLQLGYSAEVLARVMEKLSYGHLHKMDPIQNDQVLNKE